MSVRGHTRNGAAPKDRPVNVQVPAKITAERLPSTVTPRGRGERASRPEASDVVRRYAPDATTEEITELLLRYQRNGVRNPPGYVTFRHRSGDLLPDLEAVRADLAKAHAVRAIDELRAAGAECEHGYRGGLDAHPETGQPMCPICRNEGKPAHPAAVPPAADAAAETPAAGAPAAAEATPGTTASPKPELRVTPMSSIKVKATEWLWHHRIPVGALTLLPGREGTGKSMMGAWLAASVTNGTLAGLYEGIPKGVFYAAREDDYERTIAPRLIAAKADMGKVYRIDVSDAGSLVDLVLPAHCDLLRDGIRNYDVALLFLDPLMSLIAGGLDTHKDREARTALEPLSALAMETNCSVVGLAHFSKAMTTDALNLVMASKAFTAVPRAVIGMARDDEAEEDNAVVVSQVKSNLGPLDIPSLKYVFEAVTVETQDGRGAHVGRLVEAGETDRSVADILTGHGDEADQDTWNAASWWLHDHLRDAGGEAAVRDIMAAGKTAGHSRDSLKRGANKLALGKRKDGFQGHWLWIYDPQRSKAPEGARPEKDAGHGAGRRARPTPGDQPKKPSRTVTGKGGKVVPIQPEPERNDSA